MTFGTVNGSFTWQRIKIFKIHKKHDRQIFTFYRVSPCLCMQICFTNLFVHLSVCPIPVLCQNEWMYRHIFYELVGASF